jgi:hypothetical protein
VPIESYTPWCCPHGTSKWWLRYLTRRDVFPLNFDWIDLLVPASKPLAGSCFLPPVNPPAFCGR